MVNDQNVENVKTQNNNFKVLMINCGSKFIKYSCSSWLWVEKIPWPRITIAGALKTQKIIIRRKYL
tara:strand:+ start:1476 stop:1673 length:198 start_codon:yes stop_codon:yes gene_type:complete